MSKETKRRLGRIARGAGAGAVLVGLLGASWWLTTLPSPRTEAEQSQRDTLALPTRSPSDASATDSDPAEAAHGPADPAHFSKQAPLAALRRGQAEQRRFAKTGEAAEEAKAWKRIGAALFELRRVEESVDAYRKSASKAAQAGDAPAQVEALIEGGKGLSFLGKPHQALELFETARQTAARFGDKEGEASALGAVADQLRWIGEVRESLSAGARALEIWRELQKEDQRAWALAEQGRTNSLAGRDDEALALFQEALAIHQSTGDLEGQIDALTEIGWTLHWMERSADAVKRLQQAIELSRRLGRPDAGAYDRLATAYRKLGLFEESREAYRTSINLLDAEGERFLQAHVLANLAELRVARGEPRAALGYCAQAKRLFRTLDDPNALAHTLYIEASAMRDLHRLERAYELMSEVRSILESQRAEFSRQNFLDAFQSSRYVYLEFFVDLLMERHSAQPDAQYDRTALETIEAVRARSLRETLLTSAILREASPELKKREQSLRASFDALDRKRIELLQTNQNQARIAQIEISQQRLLDQFDELNSQRKAEQTALGELPLPGGLTVRQIQQEIIDDETLLLSFSLGDRRSFLWAVGPNFFETRILPPRKQVEQIVEKCHRLISRKPNLLSRTRLEGEMGRLSDLLLGPIQDLIEPGKRLAVVADGKLQYVPFAALSRPGAPAAEAARYLIEDHEIVELPSISTLAALRQRSRSRASEDCIAVWADPIFGPGDPRLGGVGPSDSLRQPEELQRSIKIMDLQRLARLPGSLREANKILELVSKEKRRGFFGFDAAREPLTSGQAGHCRFLHLASHTLLNPLHPELSGIVLSLFTEDGKARPGFLRPLDVARLDLSAEAVVLSACQTAAGKVIRGEGISGLPQSFMLAGVPRIVMSLWPVSDEATPELMSRFYTAMLSAGQSPAAALRSAQLSMIEDDRWGDPYYWAAFVLLGDWRGIE